MFFKAMLITYIKGGTPAQIVLERGSAMTRADLGMLNMFAIKLNLYDISYSYRNIRQKILKLF
jgi:hypothetical protein